MNKKKGIISLILTVVLIGLLGFTTIVGFGDAHIGASKNIKLGLDLAGGVSITYQVENDNPTSEEMSETIYKPAEACRTVQYRGICISGGRRPNQYRDSGCNGCK